MRSKKTKPGQPGWWPESKRIEAVTAWLSSGSLPIAASITKVPLNTLKDWRKTEWWKDIEHQIKDEDNQELDSKFTKIIRKTLDVIDDRLDNGNFQFDPKTGRVLRIPVNIRDTHRVMSDLVNQRRLIRHEPTHITETKENTNDRLVKLAEQFATFALGKQKDDMKIVSGNIYENNLEEDQTALNGLQADKTGQGIPTYHQVA